MPQIRPVLDADLQPGSEVVLHRKLHGSRSATNPPVQQIQIVYDDCGKRALAKHEEPKCITVDSVIRLMKNLKLSGVYGLVPESSPGGVLCFKAVTLQEHRSLSGIPRSLSSSQRPQLEYKINIDPAIKQVRNWSILGRRPRLCNPRCPATDPPIWELRIDHELLYGGYMVITGDDQDKPVSVSDVFEALHEAFKDTQRVVSSLTRFTFMELQPKGRGAFDLVLLEDSRLSTHVPDRASDDIGRRYSQKQIGWKSPSSGTGSYEDSRPETRYRQGSSRRHIADNEWDKEQESSLGNYQDDEGQRRSRRCYGNTKSNEDRPGAREQWERYWPGDHEEPDGYRPIDHQRGGYRQSDHTQRDVYQSSAEEQWRRDQRRPRAPPPPQRLPRSYHGNSSH